MRLSLCPSTVSAKRLAASSTTSGVAPREIERDHICERSINALHKPLYEFIHVLTKFKSHLGFFWGLLLSAPGDGARCRPQRLCHASLHPPFIDTMAAVRLAEGQLAYCQWVR